MIFEIKRAEFKHQLELLDLYKEVAEISDGIIRNQQEINEEYVSCFLKNSIENGLILVALMNDKIVGEIHAYTPPIYAFQHILTDLTIVVNPENQGEGIGRKLFERFLQIVMAKLTHIKRIELYTREYNKRTIKFYQSLGFLNEGRQEHKIFITKSEFETPIHMAWFNPNYGAY